MTNSCMMFNTPQQKRPKVAVAFATGLIILGVLFKIQHMPYSDILLAAGFIVMVAAIIYRIAIKKDKKPKDFVGLVLELSGTLFGLFTIMHLPYAEIFLYLMPIALIVWVLMGGSIFYQWEDDEVESSNEPVKSVNEKSGRLSYVAVAVFIAACFIIIAGILLNHRNWPFADHLMFAGFAIAVLCLIKVNYSKNA